MSTVCVVQYIPRNMHTVFTLLCFVVALTDFSISIRLTSLALWQSNDCPSASKATLMNMDKYFMWIHYERLHNNNKAKHNKAVCIFLGIYCSRGDTKTWKSLWHYQPFVLGILCLPVVSRHIHVCSVMQSFDSVFVFSLDTVFSKLFNSLSPSDDKAGIDEKCISNCRLQNERHFVQEVIYFTKRNRANCLNVFRFGFVFHNNQISVQMKEQLQN